MFKATQGKRDPVYVQVLNYQRENYIEVVSVDTMGRPTPLKRYSRHELKSANEFAEQMSKQLNIRLKK